MIVRETDIPGALILEPAVLTDSRGWFMEIFNAVTFAAHGLPVDFVQDNHSLSRRNVLRGLHYQLEQPQGKLVRCIRGSILDVAVDIRRSSPSFGRSTSIELSARNRLMLWIPPKFAHGFRVLSDEAEVLYKCTTSWHAESDRTMLWNDPEIGIDWGIESPELSAKDAAGTPFREAEVFES